MDSPQPQLTPSATPRPHRLRSPSRSTPSLNRGANPTSTTHKRGRRRYASYSPDGTKILFTSTRDGNSEIYSMNADGSNVVRLTTNSAVDDEPTWSPDGKSIAFQSTRGAGTHIWLMNADGSGEGR